MSADLFLRPLFDWRSALASPFGPKNPTTRHVLLTLSLHMSVKGDSCFPSIELLTEESGLSRRAVVTHLAVAADEGWIGKRERPEKNGQGWRRIEYFPLIPQGVEEQVKAWMEERGARRALPQGGARRSKGGARGAQKVVQEVHPSTSVELFKEHDAGVAKPTPVAAGFKAYSDGIQAKYGSPYPPSRRANGMLAQVVAQVGADFVVPVVQWYLAHQDPFYGRTKHALGYLVRDCAKFLIELQAKASAAAPKAPTHARVGLLAEDGRLMRELDEVPAGDMEAIARNARKTYAGMIARLNPKYVAVRQGTERRQFSVEELPA